MPADFNNVATSADILISAGIEPDVGELLSKFVVRGIGVLIEQRDRARATLIRATQIESLSDDDYDFDKRIEHDLLDLEGMETAPLPPLDVTETDL